MRYQRPDYDVDPEPEPEEDPSTQTTAPLPQPMPPAAVQLPIVEEYVGVKVVQPANCVMCLSEYAERFGPEDMPFEPGAYGLCFDHEELVAMARPEELELFRPYLGVLYRRYDPNLPTL